MPEYIVPSTACCVMSVCMCYYWWATHPGMCIAWYEA